MSRGSNQTRQPSNVTVFPETRRYGSYPAGYQIINTSLTATIWAADNTSCRPGQGTPISPGTSIVWNTDGDLFLCLGNDTQSVTAGTAAVVLSYDIGGWQPDPTAIAAQVLNSGVIIVDQPVKLNDTTLNYLVDPIRGPYNVSKYNSLFVTVLNELFRDGYLELQWYSNAGASTTDLLAVDHISFASSPNSLWQGQIPCRGPYVLARAFNTDIALNLVASNRACDGIQNQTPLNTGGDYGLIARNQQVLAPNSAGTQFYTPPWFGEVDIYMYSYVGGTTSTDVQLFIYNLSCTFPVNLTPDYIIGTADGDSTTVIVGGPLRFRLRKERIALNGNQIFFDVYNNSADPNVVVRTTVVPVPKSKA